ncbi:NADH dehydrogenase 1 alpha subcomplex subunit 6 ndufa6 [Chytriomyces hyalinus]|nr:NADH dehydrogenase 1 alpha subcomplex subunit 6 ndufa6 [Chytriomyces hyalinus]
MPAFVPSVVTTSSTSFLQARRRVLQGYREWYRAGPWICENYGLEITSDVVRRRIRAEYNKFAGVADLQTIDLLIYKGRTEYEETLNFWKQKTHIMRYFDEPSRLQKKPTDFLGRFYAGRD